MTRKVCSEKGKVRVPAGSGGIRIREVRNETFDLQKLTYALLKLARERVESGEADNDSRKTQ